MFRKKFLILVIITGLIVSLSLSAEAFWFFGGDDEKEKQENEQVTVTIAAGAVGNELEAAKEQADMYEKQHEDVNVRVLETPDLSDNRKGLYLQFLEANSSQIDIYQIDVIWSAELEEHFVDFNQYLSQQVIDKYFDSIIKNNTVNGKLVALPWFIDAGLLYYRTDLLEKYGYRRPPETWSELETMAAKIQAGERAAGNQDFWGYVWQGDFYEGLTCDALEWIRSYRGGTIISQDKKITINNQQAIKALNQAAGWVGEISPPEVTSMAEDDARRIWEAGNAAFMRNWPYCYALSTREKSAVRGKFEVAPLPAGGSGRSAHTLGGWNLAVSKYSEHPQVAVEVVKFLSSYEQQKKRAIELTMNPTRPALYKDEEVLAAVPFFEKLYDVFINAVPRPSTPTGSQYSQVSKAFYTEAHKVLTGDQEAEQAVRNIEEKIQKITGYKPVNHR